MRERGVVREGERERGGEREGVKERERGREGERKGVHACLGKHTRGPWALSVAKFCRKSSILQIPRLLGSPQCLQRYVQLNDSGTKWNLCKGKGLNPGKWGLELELAAMSSSRALNLIS